MLYNRLKLHVNKHSASLHSDIFAYNYSCPSYSNAFHNHNIKSLLFSFSLPLKENKYKQKFGRKMDQGSIDKLMPCFFFLFVFLFVCLLTLVINVPFKEVLIYGHKKIFSRFVITTYFLLLNQLYNNLFS